MFSWLGDLFGKAGSGIIDTIGNTVDRFITTEEERNEFKLLLEKQKLEFLKLEMEVEGRLLKDRNSARQMYEKDSSLQKFFAIIFMSFYCILSLGMIGMIVSMVFFNSVVDLPQWGVMLITAVYTSMSTKVGTIIDFLFGGSKEKDTTDRQVAKSFEKGQTQDS